MIWARPTVLRQEIGEASMRRAMLTAAALFTFAAATVTAALPAFAAYGAIAWDKQSGRYGWSKNQANQQKADELAVSGCGASGCKVVIRMTNAALCGALAMTQDGKTAGGASRKTQDAARIEALANCQKNNKGECMVRISVCSK
jgi:Domain of unknown function (DUF4189)